MKNTSDSKINGFLNDQHKLRSKMKNEYFKTRFKLDSTNKIDDLVDDNEYIYNTISPDDYDFYDYDVKMDIKKVDNDIPIEDMSKDKSTDISKDLEDKIVISEYDIYGPHENLILPKGTKISEKKYNDLLKKFKPKIPTAVEEDVIYFDVKSYGNDRYTIKSSIAKKYLTNVEEIDDTWAKVTFDDIKYIKVVSKNPKLVPKYNICFFDVNVTTDGDFEIKSSIAKKYLLNGTNYEDDPNLFVEVTEMDINYISIVAKLTPRYVSINKLKTEEKPSKTL